MIERRLYHVCFYAGKVDHVDHANYVRTELIVGVLLISGFGFGFPDLGKAYNRV